jgi:hypothetical protein
LLLLLFSLLLLLLPLLPLLMQILGTETGPWLGRRVGSSPISFPPVVEVSSL